MGIPYFYRDIVYKNPDIITHIKKCNRLFLDFNSIIHTSSTRVISNFQNFNIEKNKLYNDIFKEIVNYTDYVIKSVNPNQLIYIGIDGTAPLSKISQQRKRRYLSSYRNNQINNFKKLNNINFIEWDSNCITPGTEFMNELDKYLREYYKSNIYNCDIIISGSNDIGEGEHKIINYIKNNLGNYIDVIYGLDADLIMLSLTCNKKYIYLMREASEFKKKIEGFKYVDIELLRNYTSQYLYDGLYEKTSYLNDYVFICFFLGNDFLPHISYLNIKNDDITKLCDIYREIYQNLNEFAIIYDDVENKYKINLKFLKQFVKLISEKEQELMFNSYNEYKINFYNTKKIFNNDLEKFIYELDWSPLKNRKDINDITDPYLWKTTYYNKLLKINPLTDITFVDKIIKNYLDGLLWNVDYYFNGVYNNDWYYEYNYAPCLSDVHRYLMKDIWEMKIHNTNITITPLEQLCLVLPYQSKHLLPIKYQALYDNLKYKIIYFYPITFELSTFLKSQLWECIPLLPKIKLDEIKNSMKLIEN